MRDQLCPHKKGKLQRVDIKGVLCLTHISDVINKISYQIAPRYSAMLYIIKLQQRILQ